MTIDLNSLLNLAMLVGLVLVVLLGARLYRCWSQTAMAAELRDLLARLRRRLGRTGKSGPAPARRGEVRNLPSPSGPSRKEPRALRCRP